MRQVIAKGPFEPGVVTGDGTVSGLPRPGACCGLKAGGGLYTIPCANWTDVDCAANGGLWFDTTCELLEQQGKLTPDGNCWMRRCTYPDIDGNTECREALDLPFECGSLFMPCSDILPGRCFLHTEQPCTDELGPCCKAHLGGGCEDGYSQIRCEAEYGIFMGGSQVCADVECPTNNVPEGCREFEERVVPPGLRQWSTDLCAGVALDATLDTITRDTVILSDRMRLFGVVEHQLDPCQLCQTLVTFDLDGDANAPFRGNAVNNDPVYDEHYRAWFVLDEHGLYGQAYDAILVASFKTPPWGEFVFMSHGTFCKGPLE